MRMSSRSFLPSISLLILFSILINPSKGSVLGWIWPNRNVQNYRTDIEHSDSSLPVIPFELSENNERFIMDISKVLGIRLSDLDFCQQRVILSLKDSCNTLTDEELGKLAISLMNCQHFVEKRDIIDCSANVPLSNCVSQMNNDIKVSYANVLSRTKSVCLATRQEQFRGMTELTINKLMLQVERLRASQNQLEMATLNSIGDISDSQLKVHEKHNELLKLVNAQKILVNENLKEMFREKITLRSRRADLNLFIGKLKTKIVEGLNNLSEQNTETKQIFKDLFDNLGQVDEISTQISNRLLETEVVFADHTKKINKIFEGTTQKLKHANEVIENFLSKIDTLKQDFNLKWMKPIVGNGDDYSQRCSILIVHILYLLLGMICLVFINASTNSRFLLLGIVLISSVCTLYGFIELNLSLLLETLLAILMINLFNKMNHEYNLVTKICNIFKLSENLSIPGKEVIPAYSDKNGYKTLNVTSEYNNNEYDDEREEVIVNRSGSYSSLVQNKANLRVISDEYDKHSSRSSTPFHRAEFLHNDLGRCKAITRNGSRCQFSTPSSYTDFCRIHERSSRER